jgi:hypothetical protein
MIRQTTAISMEDRDHTCDASTHLLTERLSWEKTVSRDEACFGARVWNPTSERRSVATAWEPEQ